MNEDKFRKIISMLADDVWDKQPLLLTEEALNKIKDIQKDGTEKKSAFDVLIMSRLKSNLTFLILNMEKEYSEDDDKNDLLFDLYLRYEFYEELINKIVEKLEGGICSYDKTSHVLDAYERYLRKDEKSQDSVCKVVYDTWINYCILLGTFQRTGNAESLVEARNDIIQEHNRALINRLKKSMEETGK